MVVDVPNELLKTFKWQPRGEAHVKYDWGVNTIQFENGVKQYQQKLQIPHRTMSATYSGLIKTWIEIQNFYFTHSQLYPFFVYFFDERFKVRFATPTLEPTIYQEITPNGTKQVGFKCDIAFECDNTEWAWNYVQLTDATFDYSYNSFPWHQES